MRTAAPRSPEASSPNERCSKTGLGEIDSATSAGVPNARTARGLEKTTASSAEVAAGSVFTMRNECPDRDRRRGRRRRSCRRARSAARCPRRPAAAPAWLSAAWRANCNRTVDGALAMNSMVPTPDGETSGYPTSPSAVGMGSPNPPGSVTSAGAAVASDAPHGRAVGRASTSSYPGPQLAFGTSFASSTYRRASGCVTIAVTPRKASVSATPGTAGSRTIRRARRPANRSPRCSGAGAGTPSAR